MLRNIKCNQNLFHKKNTRKSINKFSVCQKPNLHRTLKINYISSLNGIIRKSMHVFGSPSASPSPCIIPLHNVIIPASNNFTRRLLKSWKFNLPTNCYGDISLPFASPYQRNTCVECWTFYPSHNISGLQTHFFSFSLHSSEKAINRDSRALKWKERKVLTWARMKKFFWNIKENLFISSTFCVNFQVTGVVGRAEIICSIFFLAAFIFYTKATRRKKSTGNWMTNWNKLMSCDVNMSIWCTLRLAISFTVDSRSHGSHVVQRTRHHDLWHLCSLRNFRRSKGTRNFYNPSVSGANFSFPHFLL